jgi:hypothetical protein
MGLIFRIIGFIGGITFIVNGFGVLGDPNCSSVSFSGLHAVTITCYADSTGAIPAWLGGLLSIIGGAILMGYGASPFLEAWLLRKKQQQIVAPTVLQSSEESDESKESAETLDTPGIPINLPPASKAWYQKPKLVAPILVVALLMLLAFIGNNSSSDNSSNSAASPTESSASPATYSQICSSPVGGTANCLPSPNWSYELCISNANGYLYEQEADNTWKKLWAISGVDNGACDSQYPYDLKVAGTINNLTGPINLRLSMSADATHAAFDSDFQIYPQQ